MFDPNISIELNSTGAIVHYDTVRDPSSGMIGCNVIELSDREILDIANTIDMVKKRNSDRIKKNIHDRAESLYNSQNANIIDDIKKYTISSGADLQAVIRHMYDHEPDGIYEGTIGMRWLSISIKFLDGRDEFKYFLDMAASTYFNVVKVCDTISNQCKALCIDKIKSSGASRYIYLKEVED